MTSVYPLTGALNSRLAPQISSAKVDRVEDRAKSKEMSSTTAKTEKYYDEKYGLNGTQGLGYVKQKNPELVIHRGEYKQKITYIKNDDRGKLRNVLGVAAAVAVSPALPFSRRLREETYRPLKNGKSEKVVYVPVKNKKKADYSINEFNPNTGANEGYDPTNRQSLRDYFTQDDNKNMKKLSEASNYYFMPEQRHKGISSFILVPKDKNGNADLSKISSINVWKAKDGTSLHSQKELLLAIRTYLASIDDIESGWDKKVKDLAISLGKQRNDERKKKNLPALELKDTDTLNDLIQEIRDNRGTTLVIDASNHRARIYGKDLPPGLKVDSGWGIGTATGTAVYFIDEVSKEVDEIHNPKMTPHENKLEGKPAFRDPIPEASKLTPRDDDSDPDNEVPLISSRNKPARSPSFSTNSFEQPISTPAITTPHNTTNSQ